jgi:Protein of unknown function (DUF1353)
MPFLSDLEVQQVGDFDWKLVAPLIYQGRTDVFEVPRGAETDFASVPFPFQWLIPKTGRYNKAAVLHDYLWRHMELTGISRSDADGVFRRALAELDVPFLRRWTMWAAVRVASLTRSRLRDGPRDIPQVLLAILFPGIFVVVGGALVLLLLFGFFLLEVGAAIILWGLRRFGGIRRRTKPVNRPKVRWSSARLVARPRRPTGDG